MVNERQVWVLILLTQVLVLVLALQKGQLWIIVEVYAHICIIIDDLNLTIPPTKEDKNKSNMAPSPKVQSLVHFFIHGSSIVDDGIGSHEQVVGTFSKKKEANIDPQQNYFYRPILHLVNYSLMLAKSLEQQQ